MSPVWLCLLWWYKMDSGNPRYPVTPVTLLWRHSRNSLHLPLYNNMHVLLTQSYNNLQLYISDIQHAIIYTCVCDASHTAIYTCVCDASHTIYTCVCGVHHKNDFHFVFVMYVIPFTPVVEWSVMNNSHFCLWCQSWNCLNLCLWRQPYSNLHQRLWRPLYNNS